MYCDMNISQQLRKLNKLNDIRPLHCKVNVKGFRSFHIKEGTTCHRDMAIDTVKRKLAKYHRNLNKGLPSVQHITLPLIDYTLSINEQSEFYVIAYPSHRNDIEAIKIGKPSVNADYIRDMQGTI